METDGLVDEMVRRIARAFSPLSVILFGSRASCVHKTSRSQGVDSAPTSGQYSIVNTQYPIPLKTRNPHSIGFACYAA